MRPEDSKKEKETHAWVLDYLPYGYPEDNRPVFQKKPIVQVIGEKKFFLMEAVPKEGKVTQTQERVYIGADERDVIDHVKRQLRYDELTHGAKIELPYVIEEIVKSNEERFLDVYNESYAITTRLHMLELLPGIGKKTMWSIINERKKSEFSSFEDISERIKGLYHPDKLIVKRIEEELKDDDIKYRIFTIKHGLHHQ
ncbi:MAG: DUF655 domain-containing protein [Halobacteriota archaeon]|nr:DUF655 domain-containing protein [Halobacteriota archaeon]